MDSCLDRFADFPPGIEPDKRRDWWSLHLCRHYPRDHYGSVLPECKHKPRIDELRSIWRSTSQDTLLIANRRGRLQLLQGIVNRALSMPTSDPRLYADGLRNAINALNAAEREAGQLERVNSDQVPGDVSTFFADIVRERDGAES